MKEGLLILYAEGVLAPTPFLSKFTNLISEIASRGIGVHFVD